MKRILLVVAVLLAVLPFSVPSMAAAATAAPADYCVVHVTGQKASGELTTGSPRCYATHSDAMRAEGVTAYGPDVSTTAKLAADFQIGLHCDGYNLGAPCTSVVGSGCTGGWLNVSAAWNNRISSTLSGCPQIRHYDGFNLTGAVAARFGTGPHNLTTFNNLTSSIQYL